MAGAEVVDELEIGGNSIYRSDSQSLSPRILRMVTRIVLVVALSGNSSFYQPGGLHC